MTDWPHSPPHRILQKGTYMVTCATYQKASFFKQSEDLQFLHNSFLKISSDFKWQLQAWAVMSNHYHFLANSPDNPANLPDFLSTLHVVTAKYINAKDDALNRKVWWQYWDSQITYQYSYFARLNYINQNPVRHGLVKVATEYPYCSAAWFEGNTLPSFNKTIANFKIDKLNINDDF